MVSSFLVDSYLTMSSFSSFSNYDSLLSFSASASGFCDFSILAFLDYFLGAGVLSFTSFLAQSLLGLAPFFYLSATSGFSGGLVSTWWLDTGVSVLSAVGSLLVISSGSLLFFSSTS